MRKYFALLAFLLLAYTLTAQEKLTDKRDGNVYRTVKVDGLTWMSENLRYKSREGSFYFENNPSNSKKYGLLYDWKAATRACPQGWRLPTGEEFRQMLNYIEQKENSQSSNAAKDSFDIQLGGMQDYEGNFTEMEESAYFWTSTEYDKDHAEYFSYMFLSDKPSIDVSRVEDIEDVHGTEKTSKYSVRCVKGNSK